MNKLPSAAHIGVVSLNVRNLDRSIRFYTQQLGFVLHGNEKGRARLGAGEKDFLELIEMPDAVPSGRTTGLYHFAVLVPSRYHLARAIRRIIQTETQVQGVADHLVSEAIYLPDPDGNGIEVYRDRPSSDWPRQQDGTIKMTNAPLDVQGILSELDGHEEAGYELHSDTVIGHMHLHVSRLQEDEAFYREVIGFDLVMRFGPSASFLSAGGYHHHLGINTWAGEGIPPQPADSVGLRHYEIVVPQASSLDALSDRLAAADREFSRDGLQIKTFDLSGNGIQVTAGS